MNTVKNLFLKARALLDQYSEEGILIPEADVIDMQLKFVLLADMAHKELFDRAKLDATKTEPSELTTIDSRTEVNYKADQAIIYYGAARLSPFKKKELVQYFEDKYDELKRICHNKAIETSIEDVYNIGGGGNV